MVGIVSAYAEVEESEKFCDSFSASGTSNQPYVIGYAYSYGTGLEILDVFPVKDGRFNFTLRYDEQEEGTLMNFEVWGAPTTDHSTSNWDSDPNFYDVDARCELDEGGSEAGPPCENLFDGRLNDHQALDCAAPVAIYLNEELGTVDIYAVNPDSGEGTLVIRQSTTATAQVDSNQTVESVANPFTGATITLYWLTSDEWELRTTYSDGKWYDFVWNADGVRYHLAA
jgi:hypothetical protein